MIEPRASMQILRRESSLNDSGGSFSSSPSSSRRPSGRGGGQQRQQQQPALRHYSPHSSQQQQQQQLLIDSRTSIELRNELLPMTRLLDHDSFLEFEISSERGIENNISVDNDEAAAAAAAPLLVVGDDRNVENNNEQLLERQQQQRQQRQRNGEAAADTTTTTNNNNGCGGRLRNKDNDDENSSNGSSCFRIRDIKLVLSFVTLVISGVAHTVLAKLQSIPMYNYPSFLNLYSNFLYVVICFLYIAPVSVWPGMLYHTVRPLEHWYNLPRYPFVVMGFLDCLATSMQVFASVYLPGPLLILLPQVSIPLSMVLSRHLLNERYHWTQYVGAAVVMAGIVAALEPLVMHRHSPEYYCEALDVDRHCSLCQSEVTEEACLSHQKMEGTAGSDNGLLLFSNNHDNKFLPWSSFNSSDVTDGSNNSTPTSSEDDDAVFPPPNGNTDPACEWLAFDDALRHDEFLTLFWSFVMVASALPLTLSTIYKQVALGEGVELDPIFLNGWSGMYQLLMSVVVLIPAAWLASPSVGVLDLPENLFDGFRCYWEGEGSVDTGCHPDTGSNGGDDDGQSKCSSASLWVHMCLLSQVVFMTTMMLVVKYGSTSLLFLALTVIVPIANLSFSLGIVPEESEASTALYVSDLIGLVIIMIGLILYRFASRLKIRPPCGGGGSSNSNDTVTVNRVTEQQQQQLENMVSPPPPEAFHHTSRLWSELQRTLREPLLSGEV